jgi:hypothetical protein
MHLVALYNYGSEYQHIRCGAWSKYMISGLIRNSQKQVCSALSVSAKHGYTRAIFKEDYTMPSLYYYYSA